ncbi:glycoside hydrolase family 19 protein [Methylobacterium sp. J-076]|uniref:glycoside hydrolase family 19 protein n=1 Tax=Methylobacterium sp. J-076 TaxID=2836655 RepID=UPI001FB886EB|nr:hypothetical protein [Methylobacterium sp. J-076]MCJ2011864.1 hypothetical protein [Methylobacterium sp. J-076]
MNDGSPSERLTEGWPLPTDLLMRALSDDHLMRLIRLSAPDGLRMDLLSDQDIVAHHHRLNDARLPAGEFRSYGEAAKAPRDAITRKQLAQIFPKAGDDYLDTVASDLNKDLAKFGLGTPLRKAHFFAQLREESGPGLNATVESLSYSPEGLKLFHYYKIHADEAVKDGYVRDRKTRRITRAAHQETIANKAYSSRNGNGAAISGDGWTFRGRGLIQITGRANYSAITQQYAKIYAQASSSGAKQVSFVAEPDAVSRFPYSLRSAVCFWTLHHLHLLADKGHGDDEVDRITRVVNKATKSYPARREHFRQVYRIFR